MKYYINGKEVDMLLIKKYEDILIFCSSWEEHNIKGEERYVVEREDENIAERIKELENELLQLP